MKHFWKKKQTIPIPHRQQGQGFVEYALVLGFVALVVIAIVRVMEPTIANVFSEFANNAPVAPPSLMNYTPPATLTPVPTRDPAHTNTPVPTPSETPTNTPVPTDTPVPTQTNTPTSTPTCPGYGPYVLTSGGTLRVEMENFRCGGSGVAFFDNLSNGPGSDVYRPDAGISGPDLEASTDAGGGYIVGWVQNGEWVEYEVNVPTTTSYQFLVRYASPTGTTPRLTVTVSQGAFSSSQTVTLPNTGSWQTWGQTSVVGVSMFAGNNTVRFSFPSLGANYNYFEVREFIATATATAPPMTPTNTPTPIPTPTNTPVPITNVFYSVASEDGYVTEQNATGTGGSRNRNNNTLSIGDMGGDNNDDRTQRKGFVSFDTSSIPNNATITNVQLRLQRNTLVGAPFGDSNLGSLVVDIGPSAGFSNNTSLQNSDFQAASAAVNVGVLSAPASNGAWAEAVLDINARNNINLTGTTQFRIYFTLRTDGDSDDDAIVFYSGNSTNGKPELIITYTVP